VLAVFILSTREHYANCKYCKQDLSIQHGGRDEHTYTTKQLKSAKSGTPELVPLFVTTRCKIDEQQKEIKC
jgi:hypothetical protein